MTTHAELAASLEAMAESTPRDPNKYVFIGEAHGRLTGNVKHLFLHIARNRPDVDCSFFTCHRDTWHMLTKNNLPVELFPSIESARLLATAGTLVVDTFEYKMGMYRELTKNDRIIQLWHGVGFKKIGLVEKESRTSANYNKLDLEALYSGYDTVVTTSPFYAREVFEKSFRADHFEVLGYPRNDALFRLPTGDSMLNCDTDVFRLTGASRRERKIVLWAPTFRDQVGSPVQGIDFNELHDFLDREKLHLVIKGHRLTDVNVPWTMPYISFYRAACDVYPFLRLVDMMITDYSSIYMDYLLLDRPVLFYCPDYDEFVTHNRTFQFPYDAMTPGPKCRSQEELHAALKLAASGDDGYGQARRALRDKAFLHHDGQSAQRIADHLCGPLGEAARESGPSAHFSEGRVS